MNPMEEPYPPDRTIKTENIRIYLCKEYGGFNCPDEVFIIEAKDADDAAEAAAMYNAVVIKEVKKPK